MKRRVPGHIQLRRDRALLGVFVFRQVTSIALLGWLTGSLFRLDDHRIGWAMVAATAAFTGWVVWVVARAIRRYRLKVRRFEAAA
ncbi:MAG: hypothetical protein ACKO5K_03545 [Armatimonadota bacterium]